MFSNESGYLISYPFGILHEAVQIVRLCEVSYLTHGKSVAFHGC